MKYGLNEAVARYIIYAQISSDAGKNIYDLNDLLPDGKGYCLCKAKYDAKDWYIKDAVDTICKSKSHPTGFTFFVTDGGKISPYLIYFSFKLHGKRYQISFHSFDRYLSRFMSQKNIYIRWDKTHNSQRYAKMLYQELFN